MPIIGKRKYINDRVEKLINKLDMLGYDTTEIKKRYYGYEDEEEEQPSYGSGLPYRDKINDVLQMIENLINQGIPNYYEDPQDYYNYNTPPTMNQQNDQNIYYTRQPQEFKNNLMYQLNTPQNTTKLPIPQQQSNQRNDQPINQRSDQSKPSTNFNLF